MMKEKHVHSMLLLIVLVCGVSMGASLPVEADDENSIHHGHESQVVGSKGGGGGATQFFAMTKALVKEQARLASTSEVLTLNLTNLIILLVVKAIIFGFGFLGAAAGRRSSDGVGSSGLTFNQTDLMMMMSYALGTTTDDYQCLYRTACQEPETAHQYMTASKMLLKGAKLFKK